MSSKKKTYQKPKLIVEGDFRTLTQKQIKPKGGNKNDGNGYPRSRL